VLLRLPQANCVRGVSTCSYFFTWKSKKIAVDCVCLQNILFANSPSFEKTTIPSLAPIRIAGAHPRVRFAKGSSPLHPHPSLLPILSHTRWFDLDHAILKSVSIHWKTDSLTPRWTLFLIVTSRSSGLLVVYIPDSPTFSVANLPF